LLENPLDNAIEAFLRALSEGGAPLTAEKAFQLRHKVREVWHRDVFLCHTFADKTEYVEPFVAELNKRGIPYWYDKAEIKWGDRISTKIDEGLRNSRFIVLFLTESFLERNWPETELSGALAKENENGEIAVLPILIGEPSVILDKFQLLRGKKFVRWDEGVSSIVDQLESLLGRNTKTQALVEPVVEVPVVEVRSKIHYERRELLDGVLKDGAILSALGASRDKIFYSNQLLNSLLWPLIRIYEIPCAPDSMDAFKILSDELRLVPARSKPDLRLSSFSAKFPRDLQAAGYSLSQFQDLIASIKRLIKTEPVPPQFGEEVWRKLTRLYSLVLAILLPDQPYDVSEVLKMISAGESQTLEFKATMRWDLEKGAPTRDLGKAMAREVAGLMNSEGGILIIGVTDDGNILGIETDLQTVNGDIDRYQRMFYETISSSFGGKEYCEHVIRTKTVEVYDKRVFVATIERSSKPVFCTEGDSVGFYVRVGNSIRPLNVREATEYISSHWKSRAG
jgi:hypothetical protein